MDDSLKPSESSKLNTAGDALSPDRLNAIGVLTRREIEARLIAPLLKAFGAEIGRERAVEILRQTIIAIAQEQGAQLAQSLGGDSLVHFADSLEYWVKDDALQIELLAQNEQVFNFNVTRCRYAEMYRALGIPELGALLSCNRDYALIQGFNPAANLTRTQTIMEGAAHCDFRYTLKPPAERQQALAKRADP
ncbi:MAG TPA: L-2-amino-thiazoline-4-carboxylic acid hydrolase [Anaerolineales bacterium]|nr:L-2-amino-thiazoline-4-carboxylic acid hydrolase [Anaerolineales bacterium]